MGRVLWVIIDETGHEASNRIDGDQLVVSLADGVSGRARLIVDCMETGGFEVAGVSGTHELQVSRPEFGLQSPYREIMAPMREHAFVDVRRLSSRTTGALNRAQK